MVGDEKEKDIFLIQKDPIKIAKEYETYELYSSKDNFQLRISNAKMNVTWSELRRTTTIQESIL